MDYLHQLQYLDSSYGVRAKGMILKGYFEEKKSYDIIHSYCKSFNTYLNKDRDFQIDPLSANKRLIKYVQIFIRQTNKMPINQLIAKIEKEKDFQFKQWVLEKAQIIKANQ